MKKIRDLVYNKDGSIDMQIEHPMHGWVPFTASPNDVMKYGKALYKEAVKGKHGTIKAYHDTQTKK